MTITINNMETIKQCDHCGLPFTPKELTEIKWAGSETIEVCKDCLADYDEARNALNPR